MFRLPRPLIVGLGVVPPALMILTEHPWMAAATFAAVFTGVLLRPRSGAARPAATRPAIPPAAPREVVGALAPTSAGAVDDDLPRPHDGLIHYPPRRLPL